MTSETQDVRLVLPRWKEQVLAWGVAGVGILLLASSAAAGTMGPSFFGGVLSMLVGTLAGLHLRTRRSSVLVRTLVSDGAGIWADGRCLVARRDLRGATTERRAHLRPLVHLRTKGRPARVTLVMKNDADVATFLQSLAVGSSRPVETFRVRAGLFSSKRAQSSLAVLMVSLRFSYIWMRHFGIVGWALVFAFVLVALLNTFWPTKISVGADGVLVSSLLRRSFYPFAKIVSVRCSDWGVVLTRQSGREVEIRTEPKANAKASRDREALFARIQERVAGLTALEGGGNAAVLVARGGRSLEEWTQALRTLGGAGSDGGAYRAPAVPEGELWRILEDPTSDASARAGAAVALRRSLDEGGRARLRVAAEESASPKVRVALAAVAGEATTDEQLTHALADCEEDAPASQHHGLKSGAA